MTRVRVWRARAQATTVLQGPPEVAHATLWAPWPAGGTQEPLPDHQNSTLPQVTFVRLQAKYQGLAGHFQAEPSLWEIHFFKGTASS